MKTMPENVKAFCVCIEVQITSRRAILSFWNVLVWAVSIKTVVRTRIVDRCVFDDSENAYFWEHISVDKALDTCFRTCDFLKNNFRF